MGQTMPALRKRIERDVTPIEYRSAVGLLAWTLSLLIALPLAGQDSTAQKSAAQKPAAADPDDQISRGVVIGHDGQPAANVDVWLTRVDWWVVGVEVLDNTRTDAGGRFQVKIPGRWFQAPV